MRTKLLAAFAVVTAAFTPAPLVVMSAQASTAPVTSTATIKSAPDDGTPPWARDSFTRSTVIRPNGDGTYDATVTDDGTFVTGKAGTAAPTGGTITRRVRGHLHGSMSFTVSGDLLPASRLAKLNGRSMGYAQYATKAEIPASKRTGTWPARYFKPGAAVHLDAWHWAYATGCETYEQDSSGAVSSNITGKVCEHQRHGHGGHQGRGRHAGHHPQPTMPGIGQRPQPGQHGSVPPAQTPAKHTPGHQTTWIPVGAPETGGGSTATVFR